MNERGIGKPEDDSAEFERRLSVALRKVDPPRGFTDQVIEALSQIAVAARPASHFGPRPRWRSPRRWPWNWSRPWRRAFAIAVIAIFAVAAWTAYGVYQRHEQAQVARIQSQFETALAVTSRALDRAQQQLDRPGLWQHFSSASQNISQK